MIEQLDQKLKERVNKAIGNIRLIASRSKRTNVLDATQRAKVVVSLLNDFRQYVNAKQNNDVMYAVVYRFQFNTDTYIRVSLAAEAASDIYHALSHAKQLSYREEYKQIFLLLGDLRDYLIKTTDRSAPHA